MQLIIFLSVACILAFVSIEPVATQLASGTDNARPFRLSNIRYGLVRRVRFNPNFLANGNNNNLIGTGTNSNLIGAGTNSNLIGTGTNSNLLGTGTNPFIIGAGSNTGGGIGTGSNIIPGYGSSSGGNPIAIIIGRNNRNRNERRRS